MKPLSSLEVFDLAAEIAGRIKNHLDELWYEKAEITLSIMFSTKPKLGAWASVAPTVEAPTRHEITLTYALVEHIYSEALDFSMFAIGRKGQVNPSGAHMIPEQFDLLQAAMFMFESGITFLIFHELGQINQYHGPIRAKYGPTGTAISIISEFEVMDTTQMLTGDLASIFHATELAADFEALDWMANSLQAIFKGADFIDHAYLQCAIVSCIMLMFNGGNPVCLDPVPVGSHPYPVLRMDLWIKAYAERTWVLSKALELETSKEEVTKRLMDASFWVLMKWMTRLQLPDVPCHTDFFKGMMAHQNYDSYMLEIINLWTLEYQQARRNRKYGGPFSVLYFTDQFRAKVGAAMNNETLEEHIRNCFDVRQQKDERLTRTLLRPLPALPNANPP